MNLEKLVDGANTLKSQKKQEGKAVDIEQSDLFNDPNLVPKNLPKVISEAEQQNKKQGGGSYAHAFRQKKLENIQ